MQPLDELIKHFKKMPSIGAKSAQRLAFFVLSQPNSWVESFVASMQNVKATVKNCSVCYNITISDPCEICRNQDRDHALVCIVSDPKDMLAIEKTGEYKGVYHILGGVISPIDGVTPDILKINELIERVQKGGLQELFFAINPTVEGEATILYISNLVKPYTIKKTRIAYGLPIGGDLDYADEMTVSKALEGRVEI